MIFFVIEFELPSFGVNAKFPRTLRPNADAYLDNSESHHRQIVARAVDGMQFIPLVLIEESNDMSSVTLVLFSANRSKNPSTA